MPRPKVPDSARRRCAQACDRCKKRKERCNGQKPCGLCSIRRIGSGCHYSDAKACTLARSIQLRDDMDDNSDAEIAIESLLNLSGNQSNHRKRHRDDWEDEPASQAPVPKLARLLKDEKGKFMFIGDSASLSFVQNIRRLIKSSIGDCPFTGDHLRHSMVENTPTAAAHWTLPSQLRPSLAMSTEYFHQYLLATSGVLDLFNADDLIRHLPIWLENEQQSESEITSSLYYLVLAIGAQVRREPGDEKVAELFFNHGRQLAMTSFMDDPSVLTIQSYVLITMYMMAACRRNGAFMNLGIAVRAAHAFGLHRPDTSALFCATERRTRERVWRSVRVLDLFLSASLGRPPATSDADNDVIPWNRKTEEEDYNTRCFSAVVGLCFIFERIMTEVYGKRVVSTNLVESISTQHREWTSTLPSDLRVDEARRRDENSTANLRQRLGFAHLHGAFYWSIILLTRPFLVYRVSANIIRHDIPKETSTDHNRHSSLISTFADACVDSAVRSMEIIHDLMQHPEIPKTLPIIVNSIFASGLVFGVAYFGDFDRSFPLSRGLDQVEAGLRFFRQYDQSAKRYSQIIEHLRKAVEIYVHQRDRRAMENRRKLVSHMFGQVLGNPTTPDFGYSFDPVGAVEPSVPQRPDESTRMQQAATADNSQWYSAKAPQDNQPSQGAIVTTSGLLADPMADAVNQVSTMLPPFAESGISNLSPDLASLPSYAEEIPLFSILNDYDLLLQGNFMLDTG